MTTREEIVEVINKLFVYTDAHHWDGLILEVFTENVHLDMSSLGTEPTDTTSRAICKAWEEGFQGLDAVNHLAGNYLITLEGDSEAKVLAYATATHYRESAEFGKTREFVGTYDLKLRKQEDGWRLYYFKYNLKYASGNMSLE